MAKSYKVSVFAGTKVVADMAQQVKNATIEASIQLKTIKGGATSATATILRPGPAGQNRKMEDVQGWFVNGTSAEPPVATGTAWEAPAGKKNTNWWDGTAKTWSLGSSVALPNGKDGQGLLPLWDSAKVGGYLKDAQVRDADGVTYVSLKDNNTSALSVVADWKSTGIKLDVDGGAFSYEQGSGISNVLDFSNDGTEEKTISEPLKANNFNVGGGTVGVYYVNVGYRLLSVPQKLKSIYLWAGQGQLTLGYTDPDYSNFVRLGEITNPSSGSNTIAVDFNIPANKYVSIKIFNANANLGGASISAESVYASDANAVVQGVTIGYGYKSTYQGTGPKSSRLNKIDSNLLELNSKTSNLNQLKDDYLCELFTDNFVEQKADWLGTGWAYSSASWSNSANFGVNNRLQLNRIYNCDKRKMRFRFTPSASTDLRIYLNSIPSANTDTDTEGSSLFGVNFATKKLSIYNVKTTYPSPDVTSSGVLNTVLKSVDFTYSSINDFEIELSWDVTIHTLKLINKVTGEEFILKLDGWSGGRQQQYYSFYLIAGSCVIKSFKVLTIEADTVIVGDSITEGVMVLDKSKIWSQIIRNEIGGKVLVSARGGHAVSDIVAKLTTEIEFINPKRLIVLIGINAYPKADYDAIVDFCNINSIQLYLCLYNVMSGGQHVAVNSFIRSNYQQYLGGEFDYATSQNNDQSTPLAGILYDGVHPNNLGSPLLADRILKDVTI